MKIMKWFFCITILINIVIAKYCDSNRDCGDSQYYNCKSNTCCKLAGLSCGAFYSWGCCNNCKIPKYSTTGTCT